MKQTKKQRRGVDPLFLIIGGALLLLVVLIGLTQ